MCHVRLITLAFGILLSLAGVATAQSLDTVIYYHTDAIGSVRAITDANGQVVARYDFEPFGIPCGTTCGSSIPDTRQFAGKERDTDTGLDYFGARYYEGVSGRFTSVDPVVDIKSALSDPQLWNRYAYVKNNPFRYVDPDGRALETLWDVFNVGTGLVSLGGNIVSGNLPGAALDLVGVLADGGSAAVPGLPGGYSNAIKAWRLAENAKIGRAFERAVIEALGTVKNTGAVSEIASRVTTIPDLPIGRLFGVTDIKNVKDLSGMSKQLQAQFAAAQTGKLPFNLIISPRTGHVAGTVREAVEATGGRIQIFDPKTRKLVDAVFDQWGNVVQ